MEKLLFEGVVGAVNAEFLWLSVNILHSFESLEASEVSGITRSTVEATFTNDNTFSFAKHTR